MMERWPEVDERGNVVRLVRSFFEFIEVKELGEEPEFYLWTRRGCARAGEELRWLATLWYEPASEAVGYVAPDLDAYMDLLAEALRGKLEGKRVMVDFSGGKDSLATLAVLRELSERLDFTVVAVYVYVPYLEATDSLKFAEEAARRLGVDFELVEADRRRILYYLYRSGLPRRGARWCTYLKVRALRDLMEERRFDLEAKGDRLVEAGKRLTRLYHLLRTGTFLQGRKLNVVYSLTLLDVVKICREVGLVHPHYLIGLPRVSCAYCPYKSLYELELAEDLPVEDPGLIDHVLTIQYQRYYSPVVSREEFLEQHLWRYSPSIAKQLATVRREYSGREELGVDEVRRAFSSLWRSPLPRAERIALEELREAVKEVEGPDLILKPGERRPV